MAVSLRIAVVGCGPLGARRARTLRALGIDELRLADHDAERARMLQAKIGGTVLGSTSAIAAESDAVIVCTPPPLRVGAAVEAIRAGAHVFVEAPLGDGLGGIGLLLEAAAARGRVVMVGSRLRFHPALERIRALVQTRTIGRVYAGALWLGTGTPDRGVDAARLADTAGADADGAAAESLQWLDVVRWLFGQPAEVMAAPAGGSAEAGEDPGAAILRFESGLLLQIFADGLRGHRATRVELVGTEGTLTWSAGESQVALERLGGAERRVERLPVDLATLEEAEMRHFLACILTGRTPISDGGEGRATLSLALALQRSSRLRRALAVGDHARRFGDRRRVTGTLRLVHAT
jgi:UDP-N-acetylglucosamine 3-dehydrogenase